MGQMKYYNVIKIIKHYEWMLKAGKIDIHGAAYKRLKSLRVRHSLKACKDEMKIYETFYGV